MKRNMPKCKKHVQLVQSPEKMRAGLILIVLEQLTSFASASEKQKRSGTLRKRLSSSLLVFMMLRLRAMAYVVSITSQDRLLNSVYLTTVQPTCYGSQNVK